MPRISVVLTTRNRASLLPAAVAGISAQTYADFELIVVDDASTDATPETLSGLRTRPPMRVVRIEASRGANHAREAGRLLASGEWVAFHDDDDVWRPDKLALQAEVAFRDPALGVVGCWFQKAGRTCMVPPVVRYRDLLSANLLAGFSMPLVRNRAIIDAGGLDPELKNGQDWDLWLRVLRAYRAAAVQMVLVDYGTPDIPRITEGKDRAAHFDNYMRVVEKHRAEMPACTYRMHAALSAYHRAPEGDPFRRAARGLLYATASAWDATDIFLSRLVARDEAA